MTANSQNDMDAPKARASLLDFVAAGDEAGIAAWKAAAEAGGVVRIT